jgi:predicted dehydrogenase
MKNSQNRREFLKAGAYVAAAVNIVPGYVIGLNGQTPPSGKLNIAGIGIGGQGHSDLRQMTGENIVALCDVDWRHSAGTFKEFPNAKKHKDYRKMLDEQKDIDAVVVATPDHLHAFASMAAIKLGKHVYCEKPLTHSVWEARKLAEAAREKKVAEFVWDGAIGKVTEAHVWTDRPSQGLFNEYWPQGVGRPQDTPPVPDTLDWDLWIGPAPMRPYHPAYLPFKWRGWWDFGTGALGDIGCHALDPVFRALKLGAPLTVQASSSRVNTETYPVASMVTYQFPARGDLPPVKLVWYDGGLRPPRPDGLIDQAMMGDNGRMLVGDKGFILGNAVWPQSRRDAYKAPEKTIPRSPGHYVEWIQAAKGGKPAGSNFDFAGPLAEAVLLGNVALRVQLRKELTLAKLEWDPKEMKCPNLPQASQFVKREYREGWSLL